MTQQRYHCCICELANYDLCRSCIDLDIHCFDSEHYSWEDSQFHYDRHITRVFGTMGNGIRLQSEAEDSEDMSTQKRNGFHDMTRGRSDCSLPMASTSSLLSLQNESSPDLLSRAAILPQWASCTNRLRPYSRDSLSQRVSNKPERLLVLLYLYRSTSPLHIDLYISRTITRV